ncbi:MAG: hypothetical protein ACRDQD_31715, partial [Nocardioidaceae bacterium]
QLGEHHHQPEPERVRLVAPTQPSLTTWTLTTSEVLGLDQRGEALQQLPELQRPVAPGLTSAGCRRCRTPGYPQSSRLSRIRV